MKQVKYSFGGAIDRFRPFFFARAALCLTTSLGAQSPFPDEGMPETDFRPDFRRPHARRLDLRPRLLESRGGLHRRRSDARNVAGTELLHHLARRRSRRFRAEDGVSGFGRRQQRHQLSQQRGARRARCAARVLSSTSTARADIGPDKNFEERGRTFLALRGQVSCRGNAAKSLTCVGSTGDKAELFSQIDRDGWNECHVIARGHTLIHLVNGHVMSVVVDDDPQERTSEGLIGMQVHVGPPMKIEFRNIRLKTDRKEVSGR